MSGIGINIYRNAVLHLALFVPWEKFVSETVDDIPVLWRLFEEGLSDRLRSLNENAEAVEEAGGGTGEDDTVTGQSRGRRFYTELQDIQDAPLRGAGLLGREEVVGITRAQKKEDGDITADLQGIGRGDASPRSDLGRIGAVGQRPVGTVGAAGARNGLEVGPSTSYTDVALALARSWTLNKQQALALLLPAAFLDERGARLQEEEGPQHLQYVGGEGGTGKSRVIHAIKDIFRLKEAQQTLLLTGASGNAAALVGGVTLHSAANIGFEGSSEGPRGISEEEKLRWKSKVILAVDEISQVGGLTLASVDNRLRRYRDDAQRPFGGIPIVLLFGDFYQFDPVQQTSLLLPKPRGHTNSGRPDSAAKHLMAHKLFLQFRNVVMLREQVRAAGCAKLRGFLQRLRHGEQTELDFERLRRRVYDKPTQPTFAGGLRAITPLNQDRWNLNMAAVVQYARARGRHVSIFAARHHAEAGRQLGAAELRNVLRYGDDSQLPTPGLFFYTQDMPVVVTRNLHVGLKIVNGAPFTAVDMVPDPAYATITVANDVTFHLGPPPGGPIAVGRHWRRSHTRSAAGHDPARQQNRGYPRRHARQGRPRSRGKPGFQWVTHRTGPLCTPAFAMTDQKSQGKQFGDVLLNLKGAHGGTGGATRPSFMSLYVQLSRATRWEGLYLFQEPARSNFIEPKNVLDSEMREAVARLEKRGDETRERLRREHGQTAWCAAWDVIEEAPATVAAGRGETIEVDTANW
ncbi:uncharacterized protein PG998_002973 [Apiospora kogelbergensis]|uniref:uncharacterized protein n=1 Tax=Apiospora kogelbergensis TaxID=1337665 RepID=UPI0031320B0B